MRLRAQLVRIAGCVELGSSFADEARPSPLGLIKNNWNGLFGLFASATDAFSSGAPVGTLTW